MSMGSVEKVRVDLGARSYDVLIGSRLLERAGDLIRDVLPGSAVAIVTDENVARHHLPTLQDALARTGIRTHEIIVPPGEGSKSFTQLQSVVEDLLATRLERGDVVVALGGGVVGDLAGFASAIVRRGMGFVQIPTTLLAQIDASIGGKTGINSRQGKNLVGAFHQPALVLADTDLLKTLPRREFAAGYAEVVKAGLIGDAEFFAWLESNRQAVFEGGAARTEAVVRSIKFKAVTVSGDERETAERALLNLGHTFGHALEAACGYDARRLIHGEGVSIGVVLAHRFSADLGLASLEDAERVAAHLKAAGLPVAISDIPGERPLPEELVRHMAQDKKVKAGRLTFILTRGIGRAFIADDVPPEKVRSFLRSQLAG